MTANLKRWDPTGTDEATVSSGGVLTSVTPTAAGTITYEADYGMSRGSGMGAFIEAPATADAANLSISTTAAAAGSAQLYASFPNWPSGGAVEFMTIRTSAGNCVRFLIGTAGSVTMQNQAGTTVATLGTISLNTPYRFELDCTPGSSTSNGTAVGRVYDDSDTQLFTSGTLTGNYGGGLATKTVSVLRVGDPTTATSSNFRMGFTQPAIDTAATPPGITPVAKITNVAPTANAGTDQTVDAGASFTLSGTDSDSDGTIASRAWKLSGSTVSTSATYNGTAPITLAGQVLTYTYEVTDDDGATGSDTMTVTALPAATRLHDGASVKAAISRLS